MSKIVVAKKALVHQVAFANSPYKYPALIGGLGSGKTDAGIARTLRLKYKYPTLNQAYYMPDYNLISDRAMPGFEEELEKIGQPYKTNETKKIIHLEGKGAIYFRTMDNPKKIISYEVADSTVDELDTLTPEKAKHVIKKIRERNRQKKPDGMPNTIGNITTPDNGIMGEIWRQYNRCVDKSTMSGGDYELLNGGVDGDYHLIEAATADNPFLPDDYLQDILDLYDPILAKLYTRGKMVSLTQDKVYHYYDKPAHESLRTIQPGDRLYIGVDFNVGGCANVVFVREGDTMIAVDEFAPKNTDAIAIHINAKYQDHLITILPDSSGDNDSSNASKSDIQILKDTIRTPHAPTFDYPPVNGAIRDRINAVNAKLSKKTLLVNSIMCPNFSNALATQGYDKKGKPEKFDDHVGGAIDDYNDAAGYVVARMFPVARNSISINHINVI